MPRGDGTGPMGMGSMTGRGAGFCAGNKMAGFANNGLGRGMGMGQVGFGRGFGGGGRGWRHQFFATGLPSWMRFGGNASSAPAITPEQERLALQAQAAAMQSSLDSIKTRLTELGTGEDTKGK